MPDRLAELRRQRELLQQHAAWLEREIAAEAAKQDPAQTAAQMAARVAAAAPRAKMTGAAPPAPEPDRILDEYRVAPGTLHQDVRKGCLLYFAAAFVFLGGIVALLYFALTKR